MERSNPRDFYTEVVLRVLQERLDTAFPEFGWKRDRQGWVATNQEFTHRTLGVRAERVVAHGPAPRGFLIHGADPVLWTAYLNGGVTPRGQDFVTAVRELAGRAGVDPAPLDRPQPRDRRAQLLHDVFVLCRRELESERGAPARAYLEQRGLPAEKIIEVGLGAIPERRTLVRALEQAGYTRGEIAGSGVLADPRWQGRIVGCWRDEGGNARTLWARATGDDNPADGKYLYLRGAARNGLPPYGLSALLTGPLDRRREIVLVEGVVDVHMLMAYGVANVCALGGTGARSELFERLARLGVEAVTLCLDNDSAGRTAMVRAIEQATRARHAPAVRVVDPHALDSAKDPGEHVRTYGAQAWQRLTELASCGIAWRASELLDGLPADADPSLRRAALARAGTWLGTLPPRLALEQEDAITLVAKRCGYSPHAVQRAFRARYWNDTPHPPTTRIRKAQARELER